jgi:hypothetical protein
LRFKTSLTQVRHHVLVRGYLLAQRGDATSGGRSYLAAIPQNPGAARCRNFGPWRSRAALLSGPPEFPTKRGCGQRANAIARCHFKPRKATRIKRGVAWSGAQVLQPPALRGLFLLLGLATTQRQEEDHTLAAIPQNPGAAQPWGFPAPGYRTGTGGNTK